MRKISKELGREKLLLNQIVILEFERNRHGLSIDSILAQSQKVDTLISEIEREKFYQKAKNESIIRNI
jgi:hypothetical protein